MSAKTARSRAGERGLTLVELVVTVLVLGVISVICLAAFNSGANTVGRVDDDVRGQGDQRVVSERLGRDLRSARGIEAPASASQLTIWIDHDADYTRDTGEIINWALSGTADSTGHYNVVRSVDDGSSQTVARALVSGIAFKYYVTKGTATTELTGSAVTQATVVLVTMEYDAIVGTYLKKKYTTFDVRLRNVT